MKLHLNYGSLLVPVVGLEPTRCRHQRILSPPRLPFQHTGIFNFAPPRTKFRILEGSRNAKRDICSIIHYVKWKTPEYSTQTQLTYLHFESTTSTIPSHRQVCYIFHQLPLAIFYIVAAFGGVMSPPFAVPGDLLGKSLRRSPTAALAAPSLALPLAALRLATVDIESTTSTIPSHRQLLGYYTPKGEK